MPKGREALARELTERMSKYERCKRPGCKGYIVILESRNGRFRVCSDEGCQDSAANRHNEIYGVRNFVTFIEESQPTGDR